MPEYRGLILPGAPLYERKASGFIIMDDGSGPVETAATLMCAHCGNHWIVIKGSGRKRGFCLKCMAVTCGSPQCDTCVPFEKRLEKLEQSQRLIID